MVEENRSDVVGVFLKTGALMIHPEKTVFFDWNSINIVRPMQLLSRGHVFKKTYQRGVSHSLKGEQYFALIKNSQITSPVCGGTEHHQALFGWHTKTLACLQAQGARSEPRSNRLCIIQTEGIFFHLWSTQSFSVL